MEKIPYIKFFVTTRTNDSEVEIWGRIEIIDDWLLDYADGRWCLYGIPYTGVSKNYVVNTIWYTYGKPHREDGPAVVWADGTKCWYMHGERIFTWKQYHELTTLSPQEQMIVKLKYGEQLK